MREVRPVGRVTYCSYESIMLDRVLKSWVLFWKRYLPHIVLFWRRYLPSRALALKNNVNRTSKACQSTYSKNHKAEPVKGLLQSYCWCSGAELAEVWLLKQTGRRNPEIHGFPLKSPFEKSQFHREQEIFELILFLECDT